MDPAAITIERYLAEAERHVALGEQHVARQRKIVAELERDGHDTAQARELLRVLEGTQASHVSHRDRLLTELKYLHRP
jgi:hypothetical protein